MLFGMYVIDSAISAMRPVSSGVTGGLSQGDKAELKGAHWSP